MEQGRQQGGLRAGFLAVSFAVVCGVALTGCVGTAGRVHVDDEPVKDISASDVDMRAMSREMATALIDLDIIVQHAGPVVIAFPTISNRTHDVDFDSSNIQSMIRKHLVKHARGKLLFLDGELSNLILAERDAKRSGQKTSSKRSDLPGADYFLKGAASSDRTVGPDAMSEAHRYYFRLTDAETGVIVWEEDYEFKKAGRRGVVYR